MDGTKINAQSGVSKEIKENGTSITGSPAFEYKSALKSQAVFKNLPSLMQRVNQLEQALNELQNKKYEKLWATSKAVVAVVNEDISIEPGENKAFIKVKLIFIIC